MKGLKSISIVATSPILKYSAAISTAVCMRILHFLFLKPAHTCYISRDTDTGALHTNTSMSKKEPGTQRTFVEQVRCLMESRKTGKLKIPQEFQVTYCEGEGTVDGYCPGEEAPDCLRIEGQQSARVDITESATVSCVIEKGYIFKKGPTPYWVVVIMNTCNALGRYTTREEAETRAAQYDKAHPNTLRIKPTYIQKVYKWG